MIGRIALISSALFLAAAGSAQDQKLSLPVGVWGHDGPNGPNCKKPFLKIEEKRIIQRFDEGEGRCSAINIKKNKGVLFVKSKCDWDASVLENLRDGADDEDGDSFSIRIVNNKKYYLATLSSGFAPRIVGKSNEYNCLDGVGFRVVGDSLRAYDRWNMLERRYHEPGWSTSLVPLWRRSDRTGGRFSRLSPRHGYCK